MKSYIPEATKKKLLKYKEKHYKILTDWQYLKMETDEELFAKYCKKDYYERCDPAYCAFYHTDECSYPAAYSELHLIFSTPKSQ